MCSYSKVQTVVHSESYKIFSLQRHNVLNLNTSTVAACITVTSVTNSTRDGLQETKASNFLKQFKCVV